jgi:transglutaminase-like putative cysteine protease
LKNIIRDKRVRVPDHQVTPVTLALIGKAIRDGSTYLPIRNLSAGIAATAPRKNFPAQARKIWDYFLKRWKYVKDPWGMETVTVNPRAVYNLVMGHNGGVGGPGGLGAGDCDDSTVGLGAMMMSVGFPVRIATTAPPGAPGIGFTHVFPQVAIPGYGWVTMDPVLVPDKGLGDIAPHGRMAIWTLQGDLIASRGVPASVLKRAFKMQRR